MSGPAGGAEVVLLGGGHAHAVALERLARHGLPGARLTLLTRAPFSPYSGMLPGVVAGHYRPEEALIDCAALARRAGAGLLLGSACGLDLAGRRVLCADGSAVGYDLLSIDIGATPDTRVPGAAEHALAVKPIDGFLPRIEALCARLREPAVQPASVAVVGGGAAGVELLLALRHRLLGERVTASFTLLTAGPVLLPGFPGALRWHVLRLLAAAGVGVETAARVVEVGPGWLRTADGRQRAADALWAVEAAAPPWLGDTGLTLDPRGFVLVDASLRALGRTEVFAAGDVAAFAPRPLPKAGVYAVRAGAVLADNLRRTLEGRPLRPFRPQRHVLTLLALGERSAVGARNGLTVAGRWVWWWKDRIDRRFVGRMNGGDHL